MGTDRENVAGLEDVDIDYRSIERTSVKRQVLGDCSYLLLPLRWYRVASWMTQHKANLLCIK